MSNTYGHSQISEFWSATVFFPIVPVRFVPVDAIVKVNSGNYTTLQASRFKHKQKSVCVEGGFYVLVALVFTNAGRHFKTMLVLEQLCDATTRLVGSQAAAFYYGTTSAGEWPTPPLQLQDPLWGCAAGPLSANCIEICQIHVCAKHQVSCNTLGRIRETFHLSCYFAWCDLRLCAPRTILQQKHGVV